jgi:hypothetical protein
MTIQELTVVNLEVRQDELRVPAQAVGVSHPGSVPMVIPWCDSRDAFPAHHIYVDCSNGLSALRHYIWQSGDYIYSCTDGRWHPDGRVPGASGILGQKIAIVASDLTLRMAQLAS